MMISGINKYSNVNFQARLNREAYEKEYSTFSNFNGTEPDTFVISRLGHNTFGGKPILVIDLGAGQGRNAIPIAKLGHTVYAYDINDTGLNQLRETAQKTPKVKGLRTFVADLLTPRKEPLHADFAFMSHSSQHFTPEELRQVLANAAKMLKKGGEFVFDALVRTDPKYKDYDTPPFGFPYKSFDEAGVASFREADIMQLAEETGFRLVTKKALREDNGGVVNLKNSPMWGAKSKFSLKRFIDTYIFKIPDHVKPVKLTWFALKKIR